MQFGVGSQHPAKQFKTLPASCSCRVSRLARILTLGHSHVFPEHVYNPGHVYGLFNTKVHIRAFQTLSGHLISQFSLLSFLVSLFFALLFTTLAATLLNNCLWLFFDKLLWGKMVVSTGGSKSDRSVCTLGSTFNIQAVFMSSPVFILYWVLVSLLASPLRMCCRLSWPRMFAWLRPTPVIDAYAHSLWSTWDVWRVYQAPYGCVTSEKLQLNPCLLCQSIVCTKQAHNMKEAEPSAIYICLLLRSIISLADNALNELPPLAVAARLLIFMPCPNQVEPLCQQNWCWGMGIIQGKKKKHLSVLI